MHEKLGKVLSSGDLKIIISLAVQCDVRQTECGWVGSADSGGMSA